MITDERPQHPHVPSSEDLFVAPEYGPCCRCGREKVVLGSHVQCGECNREDEERGKREARVQLALSLIPEGYAWATFDAQLPAGPELVSRARVALATGLGSAAFVGAPGEGKTSLAIAMLRVWVQTTGKVGRFEHGHRLIQARAHHRLGRGEADIIEKAIKAPLLLVDDLDDGPLAAGSALKDVMQERHAHARPTWVTTALGHDLTTAQERVAQAFGDGPARRIFEYAKIFDFSKKRAPAIERVVRDTKKAAAGDDS